MLHSTELKKVNKLKWPSEEVSVTLGREESNHKGGWGVRKGPGGKRGQWRGGTYRAHLQQEDRASNEEGGASLSYNSDL